MIYCLKHAAYRGVTPPVLACKTCCHIFISEIKRRRDAGEPMPAFMEKEAAAMQQGQRSRAHLATAAQPGRQDLGHMAKKGEQKVLSRTFCR